MFARTLYAVDKLLLILTRVWFVTRRLEYIDSHVAMLEIVMTLIYFSLECIYCEAPNIWIEPKKENLLLAAGDALRLDCIHIYNGHLADGATFSKDGTFIPMSNDQGFTVLEKVPPGSDSTTRTTTLIKEHTKVTDSGIYTCYVHDKAIKITVTVIKVVPVDAVLPPESTEVLELRCNTNGMTTDSNDVRWVWTFKNKTLRNDEKYNIINIANSGILQIKNPDRTNVGKYLCSLTQKNDVKIEKPRSVFLKASPTINNHVVEPHLTDLDLKCTASGYPIPHIVWTKDGVKLNITEYSVVNKEQNIVNSSMVLSNVNDEDDGVYSCIAYNDIEPFNATAQIVIGREVRSFLVSAGGPSLESASIPYMSTVIFVVIFCVC